MREQYTSKLNKIDIYGNGWKNSCKTEWGRQKGHSINILKNYTFCLIVENCNVPGYVSEKLYDAWCAGCVPLYYGNADTVEFIPKEMYIDLKLIKPENLQKKIDKMEIDEIKSQVEFIQEKRENLLRKVSPEIYYETFQKLNLEFLKAFKK